MGFRLRTVEVTADGRRIVRDRDLDQPALTIGRAADNDIPLADLAVDPQHARIELRHDGRIEAEALGTLGFGFDGVSARIASFDPARGAELRFGGYNLTVSRDTDGTPLVTIAELASAARREALDEKKRFALAAALPGKRPLAWIAALLVLAAFLALPIHSSLTREAGAKQGVTGDRSWSSGPLSRAHHALEGRCETCHVRPFEAVRDEACLSCHRDIGDHAAPARLTLARGQPEGGEGLLWAIAHRFGKPGPGACSDCHTEHEGAGAMPATPERFCADCHGAIDRRLGGARLGDAADFGRSHPQFRPALATTIGSARLTRVSLDDHPREASGLAFPHRLHLSPLGGPARMAAAIGGERGYAAGGLQCKDCHRPTADGVRFLPIVMERDCEACHSLVYDRVGPTFRKLRHGDIDQMVADLSVARPASSPAGARRRPGDFAAGGAYYADFRAPAGGAGTFRQAMSRDGVCGECHTPDYSRGRLSVMPVTQVSRFMAHGWFDHRPHRQQPCAGCHAAKQSNTSADLLLPGIATCRTCHLGESARGAPVPSSCAMCHNYHPTGQAPRESRPARR